MPVQRAVLLIAYHFPPIAVSSGVQRTLRFSQHLLKFGWNPIVLTVQPWVYQTTSRSQGNEVAAGVEVHRAFGLDAARHLSVSGRYPRALALPDRWATWRFDGVRKGLKLIKSKQVAAIWSTFPIATAHLIGLQLARLSGLPWVAEFRDPMWEGEYPFDPAVRKSCLELEREVFEEAASVVVTTPGAISLYSERYPQHCASKLLMIENGYDEETFRRAEAAIIAPTLPTSSESRPLTLLHSGLLYRAERDPTHFFAAIAKLKQTGAVSAGDLQIVLRASGDEASYRRDLEALCIADIVRLEPAIDYLPALEEMLRVDGLLLFQASSCNSQVPAKVYEYFRAGRAILALTDPSGDTARTLAVSRTGRIARLDSQKEIERVLIQFIGEVKADSWQRPSAATVSSYSREAQAGQLARLLDQVVGVDIP